MGYSCRASAAEAVDAILAKVTDPQGTSNGWVHQGVAYFWERGKEWNDGRITGTVYKNLPGGEHCRKAGTILVSPGGRVVRWPHIPLSVRADVLAMYLGGHFSDERRSARIVAERDLRPALIPA